MKPLRLVRRVCAFRRPGLNVPLLPLLAVLALVGPVSGQVTPPESETVELSPFVVSAEGDEGYRAANTLSGSRMNTPLFQTPAAISVLTKELLDDLGAVNTEQFLDFAVNSGREFGADATGLVAQQQDLVIRVRGFTDVQATRDYFPLGTLSSDRYNVDRVDLNRGPNSILYGIGGPGGSLNTSTKQAFLGNRKKSVSVTYGSYDKWRTEADLAFPLIKGRLAGRVNALWEDREGWRDFEFLRQKAVALAATYQPFAKTRLRVNFENNDRRQNVPYVWPVKDFNASAWIAAGRPMAGNPLVPGDNPAPGILRMRNQTPIIYAPQLRTQPFRISSQGADMRPDLPGTQSMGYWETVPGLNSPGISGVVDDINFKTVPEKANLMGPGATADQEYSAGSIFLDQRIGDLVFELAFNRRTWDREARLVLGWNNNGVIGDANPVLPGAYYADGNYDTRTGRDPGTLLPDIGAVNPWAGGLYVESQASYRYLRGAANNYRASLGYELDLTRRNKWFGRHSLAGVFQKSDGWSATQIQREYNLTPNNSDPIDAAQNQIVRRTYLDFNHGPRGAMDPWSNPIPTDKGVTAGFVSAGPNDRRITKEESGMFAVQSRFLQDRLTFTGGYRRDRQRSNLATLGAEMLPHSTNLWIKQADRFDPALESSFSGNTRTLGVVASPLKWLGLTYNRSDSIQPQGQYDMYGAAIGNRKGEGEDIGLRLNLLRDRLYVSAHSYRTDDINQTYNAATITTTARPSVNAILDTLAFAGLPLPRRFAEAGLNRWFEDASGRDRVDRTGQGYEVELVGKITANWSVSLNLSRSDVEVANVAADLNAFLREIEGEWRNNPRPLYETPSSVANYVRTRDNSPGRDFTTRPATINDAYESALAVLTDLNKQNGQAALLDVRDSLNFFTSYRFSVDAPGWLPRSRIGFGGNYRGPAVIGYDANQRAFRGSSNFIASLMLGKTWPLPRGRSFDCQLNVFNLFKNEDLLPYAATTDGQVVRWMYPRTRQSADFRMTYNF